MKTRGAAEAIRAALTAADIRVFYLGQSVDPPAVVIVPPLVTWNLPMSDPSEAQFGLALVVPDDEQMVLTLIDYIQRVGEALDASEHEFSMKQAAPGVFPGNPGELPAYRIQIEVALT